MIDLDHIRQICFIKKHNALDKLKFCRTKFENKRKRIISDIEQASSDIEQARLYFKEFNDKLEEIKERTGVKDYD